MNGNTSGRRKGRRRGSVLQLQQRDIIMRGGEGQATKESDAKGNPKQKGIKGSKGEQNAEYADYEAMYSPGDYEDAISDYEYLSTHDFYGIQSYPPSHHSSSKGKIPKKSKKSKPDSEKISKLSKKSSSSSIKAPSMSPPTDLPMMPTAEPTERPGTPTSAPTSVATSSLIRHLTPYGIEYSVTEDDRIPFRSELLEVVELTKAYLQRFFIDDFEGQTDSVLDQFQTIFTNTESDFGESIYVAYSSTAIFDSSSSSIPSSQDLDATLDAAFQGENLDGYLGMLQALPPSNIFSTTTSVTKTGIREESRSSSSSERTRPRPRERRSGSTAGTAGIAAGLTGFTLIAAAGVIRRRKAEPNTNKHFSKADCDSTSLTSGAWSLDQAAALQPLNGYATGRQR